MASFRFNLRPVLEHRARIEREHQRAVAELERDRLALEESIRVHHAMIRSEQGEARSRLVGVLDVRALRLQGAATQRHDAAVRQAAVRLAGVHQRLGAARALLLEAARRRKAVELLRERRFEAWRLEQSRAEAKAVDELAVMRGNRSGQGDAA